MMGPDVGVELTLNTQDATSEVVVTAPVTHLTIRVETRKKLPLRVKAARVAQLKLEYSDPHSSQPHLYRTPQENESVTSAILWVPKGMRILIREAEAYYLDPKDRADLFIEDRRKKPPAK